ncbi:cupin domain-containing protein [Microvirga massiliensis]|jgi:quercetin dioxygenase-like cupin family protein|uniref:cupin domain-containing protein n=1 Tax=Microvirga massiliensis TaxID=1033741 RepID=UPI00062B8DD9|nr:cupin domain-containing protein [Microvirga massiliensis]
MPGKFILRDDVKRDELEIARLGWLSNPAATGAKHLTVIEGTFLPGKGHSFHYHADQEELIYVVSGTVEHWIEQEKRTLSPGDSVFMPAGVVHATFNTSAEDAKVIAILGPSAGEMGVEQIDVSGEAPWNGLKANVA